MENYRKAEIEIWLATFKSQEPYTTAQNITTELAHDYTLDFKENFFQCLYNSIAMKPRQVELVQYYLDQGKSDQEVKKLAGANMLTIQSRKRKPENLIPKFKEWNEKLLDRWKNIKNRY